MSNISPTERVGRGSWGEGREPSSPVLPHNPPAPSACVRCGACMAVCPLYRVTGREGAVARGKLTLWELYQAGRLTSPEALRNIFAFCLLCGACTEKCAVGLDVPELVKEARAEIIRQAGSPFGATWLLARAAWQAPHLIPLAAPLAPFINHLKAWLGQESGLAYRLWPDLAASLHHFPNLSRTPFRKQAPSFLPGRGPLKIAFFSGCGVEALFPQAGLAFLRICESLDIEVAIPPDQGCCGLLAESAGEVELSLEQARRLVRTFSGLKVDYVVTACASCSYRLKRLGPILAQAPEAEAARRLIGKMQEASEFLVRVAGYQPLYKPLPGGVVYHDPCHLRRGQDISSEPRQLLTATLGETFREAAGMDCCGMGGVFGVISPEVSRNLGQERLAVYEAEAGVVATSCSGCLVQLTRLAQGLSVVHLLELV